MIFFISSVGREKGSARKDNKKMTSPRSTHTLKTEVALKLWLVATANKEGVFGITDHCGKEKQPTEFYANKFLKFMQTSPFVASSSRDCKKLKKAQQKSLQHFRLEFGQLLNVLGPKNISGTKKKADSLLGRKK